MPNSGLNVVNGGGSSARGAKDVSNGTDFSAAKSVVSPQNRNDTTRCNINMAYYSYQKQVYQRQILLQQQQQQQQQLKLRQEEKQLRREEDPEGEREICATIQASSHSHRDKVNKRYSPPYRKHTSDDNSFDNIGADVVVKEAAELSDDQQKPTSQKMDTSCAQNNYNNNNHIPEPCHVPGEPSSRPVSQKKRKIRSESSGIVVHIPTSQQKKPKTSHPYHIPTPSPMYRNDFMGGSSPLPHTDVYQNSSGMQQFGQIMNPYGHPGMQPMSMPPHGMAPPYPATQYYYPPPPPHPGFIPNHGNTGYPMNHPHYHHSVVAPQFARPQFHGPVAEVRDESTESMTWNGEESNPY